MIIFENIEILINNIVTGSCAFFGLFLEIMIINKNKNNMIYS